MNVAAVTKTSQWLTSHMNQGGESLECYMIAVFATDSALRFHFCDICVQHMQPDIVL